jgi:flagellar motility protein MotE (MotC chaperone)
VFGIALACGRTVWSDFFDPVPNRAAMDYSSNAIEAQNKEVTMGETRRRFLMTLAAAASCSAAMPGAMTAQAHKNNPFPSPPESAETQNPAEQAAAAKSDPQIAKRVALQQNEKEFRAGVDRLYELASELKQEVDKTVTTDVFSLQMYKRTEEIAKVAKLLKGKAKG